MAKYATSERTYEALIHAAGELAAEKGFSNVSTRAIAKRSGVNIGGIHYHFGGKEKLFAAVIRHVIEWAWEHHFKDLAQDWELDTPLGRSRAIRDLVHAHMSGVADKEGLDWYARVMFQALREGSWLLDIIIKEFVVKIQCMVFALLDAHDPGLTKEQKHLFYNLIIGPTTFHANYPEVVLELMDASEFSPTYLAALEDAMAYQAQCLLGLPPDKERKG